MPGDELAIEQDSARAPQCRHQPGHGHLRAIAGPTEHRFAAEHPVKPYPIKPAQQRAIVPTLDRMRVTLFVQRNVAARNPAADPGFVGIAPGLRTSFDHSGESLIASHFEGAAAQYFGQRMRTMKSVQRQHCTAARLDPEDFRIVARVSHWKDAAAISQQQQRRINRRRGGGSMHGNCYMDLCRALVIGQSYG